MDWPVVDEDIVRGLPPIVKAVVTALGYSRAKNWLKTFGGQPVYVPEFTHTMLDLDPEQTARMREMLKPHMNDDRRVCLPKADKLMALARNTHIRQLRHKTTARFLAHKYNLTTRHIRNICHPDNEKQLDLFY